MTEIRTTECNSCKARVVNTEITDSWTKIKISVVRPHPLNFGYHSVDLCGDCFRNIFGYSMKDFAYKPDKNKKFFQLFEDMLIEAGVQFCEN